MLDGRLILFASMDSLLKISATVPILDHTAGAREGCASAASAPAAGGRFECRQR